MPSSDESQTEKTGSQTGVGRRSKRAWAPGVIVSFAAHLAMLAAFLTAAPSPAVFSVEPAPEPVIVVLAPPPPPLPVAEPDPPPGPAEPSLAPERSAQATLQPPAPRPRPPAAPRPPRAAPPEVEPVPVAAAPPGPAPAPPPAGVTLAQLAGAATAGSGTGGGGAFGGGGGSGTGAGRCDMVRRVQDALRNNPGVVASAARAQRTLAASHRALLVWDGDWVMNPGEEGRGLAGLRQAIAVAIAFAPAECRRQSMRGLVLLTLEDDADGPRLALGQGSWRWSDLTGAG